MGFRARLLWLPPPVVTAATAAIMWLTHSIWPLAHWPFAGQGGLALFVGFLGLSLMLLAAKTMHSAQTTLMPFDPSQASALVTQGIFRYSRNPIYLGDLCLLLAWALWLGAGLSLVWLGVFVFYMSKVQIKAEEQALQQKFGLAYQQYCQQVRRWL